MAQIIFSKETQGDGEVVIPIRDLNAEITNDTVVRVDHDLADIDSIPSDYLTLVRNLVRDNSDLTWETPDDLPLGTARYIGVTAAQPEAPAPTGKATKKATKKATSKPNVVSGDASLVAKTGMGEAKES